MNNRPEELSEHLEIIRRSLETEGFDPDDIEQMLKEVVICQSREKPEEQVEEYVFAPYCAQSSEEEEEEVLVVADKLRPKILYRELAMYTDLAYENKVEGIVLLSVVFTKDATVNGIRVVRGLPNGLTESAIAAVKKIRFEPARKDGKPVSVRGNFEINFSI